MCQLETIDKYYNNLQYNESNREEILAEISALAKTMKFKNVNDISERFLETASVIEKNLSLFQSLCKHVDMVTTIIEYLTNFGVKLSLFTNFEEEYERDDIILLVMLTLVHICEDSQLHLFLEDAIYKNYGTFQYDQLRCKSDHLLENQFNEMILLEDSDLYAVINYLRIIYPKPECLFLGPKVYKRKVSMACQRIWVQEFIKEKFLWLVKEYLEDLTLPIYVFRSRKELLTNHEHCKMKIVSIWSEDIIAAKNLAASLNKEVLFINTHLDLYGGIALLPYIKIFNKTLDTLSYKQQNFDVNNYVIKSEISLQPETQIYNLFYYGKWQQPVKNTYWMCNETLWAHATSYDIKRCIDSAEKGFKIWSTKSITSRNQILFKFASMLECNGKLALADKILKWIKFSNIYETLLCSQSERLEITKIRKPRGVIILKEKDETVLFYRLTQILIAGNSVIVICDGKDSCSLAQYCDKFSVSEIPSGVINLLSHDNLKTLELSLCTTTYDSYAEQFFLEDNPKKTYINLTIPKYIILPIK